LRRPRAVEHRAYFGAIMPRAFLQYTVDLPDQQNANFSARQILRENSRKASCDLKNSPTTLYDDFCIIAT
jgi:hypothetical protein